MKINKQKIIVLCMIMACIAVSGCGKEMVVDEASSKVIQISVAPVSTPTPAPDQINADAVVTNGNLTMVNGYLAGQDSTDTSDTSGESDISNTSDDGDTSEDMNTDTSDAE